MRGLGMIAQALGAAWWIFVFACGLYWIWRAVASYRDQRRARKVEVRAIAIAYEVRQEHDEEPALKRAV